MSANIKISVVSYLNSFPFIRGLKNSDLMNEIVLSLDIPSVCAQKTLDGTVDVGLIPVAVIPLMKEAHIISDYCIGAVGKVHSVMMYSMVPLNEIQTVLLDYQSRTSVQLVQVLARHLWKISPEWKAASKDFETSISGSTAAVIIGDRTFGLEKKYPYAYDLAEEWQKLTGLPFVFACWVANKPLPGIFIEKFNAAVKEGLDDRPALIKELELSGKFNTDVGRYLNESISYTYDGLKKKALSTFLEYIAPAQ